MNLNDEFPLWSTNVTNVSSALQDTQTYRILGQPDTLETLMGALEKRGAREGALYNSLLRHKDSILQGMPAEPLK